MLRARVLAICLLAAPLAACSEDEVYSGLSEREANDMLATIQSGGLHGSKASRDGKSWTISAPKAEFPRVIALLEERNFPREKFENLGGVFKKEGFVSSPVEEHARLIYGLSQELSDTISRIDGVVSARVHIALPEADPLSDVQKPSSASVFIKYDPEVDLASQVGSIKALVANSIEGLPLERISVVLTPARKLTFAAQQTTLPAPPLLALLGLSGALGGGAIWWLFGRRLSRERALLP